MMMGDQMKTVDHPKLKAVLQDMADTYSLSPREHEFLVYLTEGRTNKEIAEFRQVRPNTVRNTAHSVYKKMGVNPDVGHGNARVLVLAEIIQKVLCR